MALRLEAIYSLEIKKNERGQISAEPKNLQTYRQRRMLRAISAGLCGRVRQVTKRAPPRSLRNISAQSKIMRRTRTDRHVQSSIALTTRTHICTYITYARTRARMRAGKPTHRSVFAKSRRWPWRAHECLSSRARYRTVSNVIEQVN